MKQTVPSLLLLAILLIQPTRLRGDGCFIPEDAFAKVTIPDQRALIHFKDGIETLVIDTSVNSASTNLAWIVPLPAPPEIAAATPGLFTTLEIIFGPKIVHDPGMSVAGTAALAACVLLIFVAFARKHPRRMEYAVVFLILVLLSGLMLPAFSTAGGSHVSVESAVQILDARRVGSFDTVTLKGETGAALLAWLNENGFPTPEAQLPEIHQYAKEGWIFVAAKVHRESSGEPARVHPVSFRFSTDRAVYPLRLTGINNGTCRLELFVFGDQRAELPGWKVERCDPVDLSKNSHRRRFSGTSIPTDHPYLERLTGEKEIATKLSASLAPKDMTRDAYLNWVSFSPERPVYYSRQGAFFTVLNIGIATGLGMLVLIYAIGGLAIIKNRNPYGLVALSWLILILLAGGAYLLLPKVEVSRGKRLGSLSRSAFMSLSLSAEVGWRESLKAQASVTTKSAPTVEQIRVLVHEVLADETSRSALQNRLLGTVIREDDSPGNYSFEQRTNGVWMRYHGISGGIEEVHAFSTDKLEDPD